MRETKVDERQSDAFSLDIEKLKPFLFCIVLTN